VAVGHEGWIKPWGYKLYTIAIRHSAYKKTFSPLEVKVKKHDPSLQPGFAPIWTND